MSNASENITHCRFDSGTMRTTSCFVWRRLETLQAALSSAFAFALQPACTLIVAQLE